ncbi:MAG: signal peptidase II [Clostridia bacterium]|nr:signal peptidase II [Clostridia bacterium]
MLKNTLKKLFIISIIVIADIVTKILLEGKSLTIINGILSFESSHNTGAAWSMLEGKIGLFVAGAIVFVVAMFLFDYFAKIKNRIYFAGFCLMLAGAIGNLIDRAAYGYVRDFIKLDFINFPIFNIADASLVVGCILFSIFILFVFDTKKKVE